MISLAHHVIDHHQRASINDLLCFYTTVVRPVLEYACSAWHSSLTVGQHEALKSLQKRAMRIIFNHDDYLTSLILAGIDNLNGEYGAKNH